MKCLKVLAVAILFISGSFGMYAFAAEQVAAKPLLIDVRTEAEWQEGHLDGAILIPYEKIGDLIVQTAPDKKAEIRLYCRTGRRSGIALDTLKKLGYENVSNDGSVENASKTLKTPVVK